MSVPLKTNKDRNNRNNVPPQLQVCLLFQDRPHVPNFI